MYRELTEKNNDRIETKNKVNQYKTHIPFKARLLRTSLLCVFIFSLGLFIAYQYCDRLVSFEGEISNYFGLFSNAGRDAFFDCMIKISFKDFFVLLLLLLSALTFFCDAMANVLLALCGLFWGICSGVLAFGDTVNINELLYIGQAVVLMVLFVFVSQSAASFNRAFIGRRSKSFTAAELGAPSFSPLMAKYVLRAVAYIFVYLIIKTVYCIFQFAIQ